MAAGAGDWRRALAEARACTHCASVLPLEPKPILQVDPHARILIAGQAPGRRAHDAGIPFDDASGDRLRAWLGVDRDTFYDARRIAIVPMGLCFPGTAKGGDLPPLAACAPLWRTRLLNLMPEIQLTLVIGRYAQAWHLPEAGDVTAAVTGWRAHWPAVVPLPHPSPRNQAWLKRNPWFAADLLPRLRERVAELVG
ncbi:uracil-DNA glycosylase family protein [Tahibacter soli]|uniref:Uracil-DNA glycosylase family protein n=1 Tax=Tahibacter soli TaxID=2983605 RepID=A0A9X3YQV0_9GAMM|nr:uracil-DNA glycosylase family protein [Tahibacter soli]MDC8015865.1 uracil-DNA glycosylase family protein [Tahibacter soli]